MQQIIAKFSVFNTQEFIFLALCFLLLIDVIYFLWNFLGTKSFLKNAVKTTATIVEVRVVEGEKSSYQELTLFFKDQSGIEFSSTIDNMFKPRLRGENIEIFYSKKDSSDVRMGDWRSLHMKSFVSFAAGVVTVAVGYWMWGEGMLKLVGV